MPNSGSGWTGLSRSPQSSSKSSLQRPRPWGIPFRVDVAQLQAHASTFLWQKAMPGMIANSEHQHVAEFGRELESVISAIAAAQNPEPTSLIGPLAAEPEQHSDDLRPGSKRGNKSPIDSPFLERLFPPCCGWLNRRTPFHGGNRHGLPGYFVRLGHAM